jgi:lysophospholipase L1-like esterase
MPLLFLSAEFVLRAQGYHRTVYYERQGDLLFTPVPNQHALEKISLTPSHINNYGLRGPDVAPEDLRRRVILCLGDSITYGYGVADGETYPARLQEVFDRRQPGEFTVLNGGVNAYPISLMHQKFLYLWHLGIRPDLVIVGYSMNEGWLGHLVSSDAAVKDEFEGRVRMKNLLRRSALYNIVVENLGLVYYNWAKEQLVPGTHQIEGAAVSAEPGYKEALTALVDDLRAREVAIAFLVMGAFNKRTGRYDTEAALQREFVAFADAKGIPVLRSDEVFRRAAGTMEIGEDFLDRSHMSVRGNAELAASVADWLAPQLTASEMGHRVSPHGHASPDTAPQSLPRP